MIKTNMIKTKGSDFVIQIDQIKGQLPALQVMLSEAGESL